MQKSGIGAAVSAVLTAEGRFISRMKITVETDNPQAARLLSLNMQGEFFGFEIIDDFSALPPETRDFILLFKTYSINVAERQNNEITVNLPADTLFFRKLIDMECMFKIGHESFRLRFEDAPYPLKIDFDETMDHIRLTGMENFYLIESSFENYIMDKKRLYRVPFALNQDILRELFISGSIHAEYGLKNKLLSNSGFNKNILASHFNLPEMIEMNDAGILFFFSKSGSGDFQIRAFISAISNGRKVKHPFHFSEIRKSTLLREEILIPMEKNKILLARPETPFYEKLQHITDAVKNSFFEILNEFQKNEIVTSDSETMFHKFLPSVMPYIELRTETSRLGFLHGSFEEKTADISPSSNNKSGNIDWLEVSFRYRMQDIILSLAELSVLAGQGYIEKDSTIIVPSPGEISSIKRLLDDLNFKKEEPGLVIQPFRLPYLVKEGLDLKINKKLPGLSEFIEFSGQNRKVLRSIPIPDQPGNILRSYQKTGIYWMDFLKRTGFSGILADEMGLGKTVQVLAFLLAIKDRGHSLIVCPTALVYNWVNEIRKFIGEGISYIIIDGAKKERVEKIKRIPDFDLAITSYPLLHADSGEYRDLFFRYCIIDEAQHIKNKQAKRTQSIKNIRAQYRLALTGTPVENTIAELWSIFDFLMPDFLGSHSGFKKRFENPLAGFNAEERISAMRDLKSLVKPFILRRTKDTVLKELPKKIEQEIVLELTEKQKALYLETLSSVKKNYLVKQDFGPIGRSTIDILAALTRLRQLCLHPGLIDPSYLETPDISIKLKALMELILESIDSGHRVAVFSQFVEMLKIIRLELKKEEIEYSYIDGQTKNRFELVEHFNASDIPVFLISLKAGGTGLNIIGADSVILFDPWWNPAVENQAIDRVHRIGQKSVVHVYRLLTLGTIEEKIKRLQFYKKDVFDSLITQSHSFIKNMTWDDLRNLIEPE